MSDSKYDKSRWSPAPGDDTLTGFTDGDFGDGSPASLKSKQSNTTFTEAIDVISRISGLGSLSDAYQQMLKGINHRGLGNPIRTNRDNSGIVLFTRPDFNLTYDNIALCRLMTPLLTDNEYTLQRYIRAMLDVKGSRNGGLPTPLVNPYNPFIPLLTNNLLTVSGWPDIQPGTYNTTEGLLKESQASIDGLYRTAGVFDLSMSFRNVEGDPITAMMATWVLYATLIQYGELNPYPENIIENRYDYNTRITHLVMDPSRRFVTKIAVGHGSFPNNVPMGANFNFSGEQTYVQSTEQININFTVNGAEYNDPILIDEFNRIVAAFNPSLKITGFTAGGDIDIANGFTIMNPEGYIRLRGDELKAGNYSGIPLIHPTTQELFWYVTQEEYDKIILEVN
jgi:hypothetical protein